MDQAAVASGLAHGAFHLRMSPVSDQDQLVAGLAVAGDLQVDLGDQGAGGVEDPQTPPVGLLAHGLGDPVGAEDDGGPVRDLVQLVDEDGAAALQSFHDEAVVDHLVADVDRCPVEVEHALDDLDGTVDAGTEAAGVGE